MEKYKKQTGICLIIAEKEDGAYDVNMGSNADLPQDGLPVKLYLGILQAVCDIVNVHNEINAPGHTDRLLLAFKDTAEAAQRFAKSGL